MKYVLPLLILSFSLASGCSTARPQRTSNWDTNAGIFSNQRIVDVDYQRIADHFDQRIVDGHLIKEEKKKPKFTWEDWDESIELRLRVEDAPPYSFHWYLVK